MIAVLLYMWYVVPYTDEQIEMTVYHWEKRLPETDNYHTVRAGNMENYHIL